MRIAIIPARGGSKRVPRKNVRPFLGVPMIAHPIRLAIASGLFDRIVVSTDDDEIAEISTREGAEVPFRRAPELADDYAGTRPVIVDALASLDEIGVATTVACCIYPCTPMLHDDDLKTAFRLLEATPAERFVFPVTPFPAPIERALRCSAEGVCRPANPDAALRRTQDFEPAYRDAGQFYLGTAEAWRGASPIFDEACTFVLPATRAIDIDTEDDWTLAEILVAASRGTPGP